MRVHVEFEIEGEVEMQLFSSFQKFVTLSRQHPGPVDLGPDSAIAAVMGEAVQGIDPKPRRTRKAKIGPAVQSGTAVLEPPISGPRPGASATETLDGADQHVPLLAER